ncbi:MAG: FAD-dependent oxidoreductase [Elusimicrobiota bacterium]
MDTDILVVGSGPAGLQAAIHAANRKVRVLVLGRLENSALLKAQINNYWCIDGIGQGKHLLEIAKNKAKSSGAEFLTEDVLSVKKEEEGFKALSESGHEIHCRAIIFTTGISRTKLGVKGESEFVGRGVSYCVDCDAPFFRGKKVAVIGNSSAAVSGAFLLAQAAGEVSLIAKELKVAEKLEKELKSSSIKLLAEEEVAEIKGDAEKVNRIVLKSGKLLELDGVFIELGSKGVVQLVNDLMIDLDREKFKYIVTNKRQETNVPGVYAAGDVTGPPFQLPKAIGEGCIAGLEAVSFVQRKV